jgi:glycolate oxidase
VLLRLPDLPLPSRAAVDRAKVELERRLGPSKVLTGADACATYASDDSDVAGRAPDAVVVAASAEDVATTLAVAEACEVPVTPRAGGTGRTGGAVPVAGGIVLATHALARIKDIDRANLVAVVEPGVVTGELHAAVEREGLFYAPDPNSLESCMIGGNLAENAGGPRVFKYGATRDWVLGLEACLVGGRVVRTGKRTVKGVTGYDVTSLLVGSEGTLAVFTEATLRLVPKPPAVATALALYSDVCAAANAVGAIVAAGVVPRCLEMLDAATLDAVRAAGVSVDARAGGMLLVEVDGEGSEATLLRVGEVAMASAGCIDVVVAQDAGQRDRLWAARRMLSKATRRLARHKLSEDVVVPRTRIAELLARADRIGEATGARHLAYGHAGDGNLHVNFLWNDDAERPAVDRAIGMLMRDTIDLGGTLSGEHGIGVSKAEYLPLEQSEALIALQRDVKRAFDPKGLLNPGKIFPSSGHRAC